MTFPGPGADEGGAPPAAVRPPVRPEILLFLGALALLLVFLAIEPYLSYAVFGSDSGEYYHLTVALVTTGHLPVGAAYGGWGTAYPDFPGIYLLAGAGVGALGLDPFTALTVLVPVVSVLAVLPLFLLFRRLYPHDMVALLAAGLASVAMPRLFSMAHPAPLALGDFLGVAALWMFIEGRRDARWYVPLSLTGAAVIVTHHLSTYFFAVGAFGALALLELWRPGLWSRRFPTREFVFLGAFAIATFLFWIYGTTEFVATVISPALGARPPAEDLAVLGALALGAIGVGALLVWWRRARFRPTRAWVRAPSDRSVIRDAAIIGGAIAVGTGIIVLVPVPGTTQSTTVAAILWFSPVFALAVLASGSRRSLTTARLGPFATTWLGALGLSAAAFLLFGSLPGPAAAELAAAIPVTRYPEYLVIPLGLLAAVGIARLVVRARDRGGRRAFVAAAVGAIAVLAANAAIVYPPQADLGGFEEGLTHGDAGIWLWIGLAEPPTAVVASDHRLSSMIFGFDGNPATWDSTTGLFIGSNWTVAAAELRSSLAPHAPRAIDLVAVDSVMYSGVALNPSNGTIPLSSSAIDWFGGPPFVLLYENGRDVVYLVDASEIPG
jgi:hypothetical protein